MKSQKKNRLQNVILKLKYTLLLTFKIGSIYTLFQMKKTELIEKKLRKITPTKQS